MDVMTVVLLQMTLNVTQIRDETVGSFVICFDYVCSGGESNAPNDKNLFTNSLLLGRLFPSKQQAFFFFTKLSIVSMLHSIPL